MTLVKLSSQPFQMAIPTLSKMILLSAFSLSSAARAESAPFSGGFTAVQPAQEERVLVETSVDGRSHERLIFAQRLIRQTPETLHARDTKSDIPRLDHAALSTKMQWPGSFSFMGTRTRAKLSGFAELDVTHDNHAIATPTAFVTSAILVDNPTGADGQTHFTVQASRMVLETRTSLSNNELKTYLSADAFGDFSSTEPEFNLRRAYGVVTNILLGGDLLFGQDWSTVADLSADPNTLDYEGPSAFYGERVPLLRWTRSICRDFLFELAMETPNEHSFINATPKAEWPDIAGALSWTGTHIQLKGSILYRDLRAAADIMEPQVTGNSGIPSEDGWGASFSGRVHMPDPIRPDFWTFWLVRGDGIGSKLNDAPPDAIYDIDSGRLQALPVEGWTLSYQHWWNTKLYSVGSYSELNVNNFPSQMEAAYGRGKYGNLNLVWTPFHNWLFGIEVLRGTRQNKDGRDASVTRFQLTSRLNF